MEYVKLFIVLSWILAIFGIAQQVKAKKMLNVRDTLGAWKVQNRATIDWAVAYILLAISMLIFEYVKL